MADFEKSLNEKRQELSHGTEFPLNEDLVSFQNESSFRIEKHYFVLNKQLYTSQKNNVTCKVNYYEPCAIKRGQGANAFYGILTDSQFVDRRYYDHLDVGMYTFVYELARQGHQLQLVAIKPYLGA